MALVALASMVGVVEVGRLNAPSVHEDSVGPSTMIEGDLTE
jgi:hypothetical protein